MEIDKIIEATAVTESTAVELRSAYAEFLTQIQAWANKARQLKVTDASQKEAMAQAKEARLALVKIRTTADKKRKELKEESLRYGKAVQEVYNEIERRIKPIEAYLHEQENFIEIQRQKQQQQLRESRIEKIGDLMQYMMHGVDLGVISEDDFNDLLEAARGKKQRADDEKRAAEKERERIEKERLEMQKKIAELKAKNAEQEALLKSKEVSTGGTDVEKIRSVLRQLQQVVIPAMATKTKQEAMFQVKEKLDECQEILKSSL